MRLHSARQSVVRKRSIRLGVDQLSINHLFQLGESACLLGRFREFN
jgi:hypothetical protein